MRCRNEDYRGTKILYYFRGCGNCRSTFSVCQTLDKSRQIESRQSQQELLYQCRRCKKIEPKDKEPVETVGDSGKTYEKLKTAILWVLENRGSTLDVDTLGIDTLNEGYEKTTGKIDKLFEKHLPKELRENSNFDYAYMTIYDNAFKQGYKTGYYALLEDLENLIKHDQIDLD